MTARRGGRRRSSPGVAAAERGPRLRLDADPQEVGRGLGQLVVVVLELLREVLERQAIRRMEGGGLTDAQIDDLGCALLEIRASLVRVRDSLGLTAQETEAAVTRAGQLLAADTDGPGWGKAPTRPAIPDTNADAPTVTSRGRGIREKARTAP
ncbi:Gas vesicle protein K [Frankia sp. AiPs1]|uniref:gas vesicle protein K n=1 Tax=Frankia sp. AiPa1 TaxID=573492 RepID=UPI00202B6444|nr:gas vesicle protein K [Frankia sp. AiPa1]MCL9759728.1 gas vesicle protein K [Frankia sp. AiPa1]